MKKEMGQALNSNTKQKEEHGKDKTPDKPTANRKPTLLCVLVIIAIVLIIAYISYAICLIGDSPDNIDRTKPVFETKNISRIVFFTPGNHENGFEVPSAYMNEIVAWFDTFRVGAKAGETYVPGTGQVTFEIEYTNGTVKEYNLSLTIVDGAYYYMTSEEAPACYLEIIIDE